MIYNDMTDCNLTISRENGMMQPGNNMQSPNDNANRPSDQWPNCGNNCHNNNNNCHENGMQQPHDHKAHQELLNKIRETVFALVDLNLYLDTHPNCKQALELFTSLAFTLESFTREYTSKYGPLKAVDVTNDTPFEWVSDKYLWPWQIKKEE